MNFAEIKTDCWIKLDDDPTAPQLVDDTTMGRWINDALQSLAPELKLLDDAALTFTDGVATLPTDFVAPEMVRDGDRALVQIFDLADAVSTTGPTYQYYIGDNTSLYIFGTTPTGTVTLYYYKTPAALVNADDAPSQLPLRFHDRIWAYVKAQYMAQTNRHEEYARFMNIWETEVKAVVGRQKAYPGVMRSVW
jgi:hypothetical protein